MPGGAGDPTNPEVWFEQTKRDLVQLEARVLLATRAYLEAKFPAVRLDRLVILKSLEDTLLRTLPVTLSISRRVADPEEVGELEGKVMGLYQGIYVKRVNELEKMWAEEQAKGARSYTTAGTLHPIYQALIIARNARDRVFGIKMPPELVKRPGRPKGSKNKPKG